MKPVFRERDYTRVALLQSVLEAKGIQTFVRNQYSSTQIIGFPNPAFFPALCVVNDEDYEEARQILKDYLNEDGEKASLELPCPACGERNPGNFEICWNCGAALAQDSEQ